MELYDTLFWPWRAMIWGVLGLLGGGFLTVVVTRGPYIWQLVDPPAKGLPEPYTLSLPRSHCPACQRQLGIVEVAPLVGYLFSRGRCRGCGIEIPWRYPVLEALGLMAGMISGIVFVGPLAAFAALVFLLGLLALSVIDIETGYLPDAITLPLIIAGLVFSFGETFIGWRAAGLGAAIGFGAFWGLAAGYRLLRGREGLGGGDAKLLAAIGAFTGPMALPFVLLFASGAGLIATGLYALRGGKVSAETPVRFGPHLAAGGAIALLLAEAGPRYAPWVF